MPISRHFEVVYRLLHKKAITAGELARHFEVSTRTIYRDIDVLSAAGIPVYSSKGRGGGISLLEGISPEPLRVRVLSQLDASRRRLESGPSGKPHNEQE